VPKPLHAVTGPWQIGGVTPVFQLQPTCWAQLPESLMALHGVAMPMQPEVVFSHVHPT
jgi:hypothetical protein